MKNFIYNSNRKFNHIGKQEGREDVENEIKEYSERPRVKRKTQEEQKHLVLDAKRK